MSWRTTRLVEFQHCDPAGIVFYPRYFEMINSVIEEFFREALGYGFAAMHFNDRRGVPTVSIKVEFHAPSRLEDMLYFSLTPVRIGTSSLDLEMEIEGEDGPRLSVASTLVRTNLDSGKSDPWPQTVAKNLSLI